MHRTIALMRCQTRFIKAQPPLERVAPDGHFHRSVGLHGAAVDDAVNQRVVENATVVLRKLGQIRGTVPKFVAGRAVPATSRAMTTRAIEQEQPMACVTGWAGFLSCVVAKTLAATTIATVVHSPFHIGTSCQREGRSLDGATSDVTCRRGPIQESHHQRGPLRRADGRSRGSCFCIEYQLAAAVTELKHLLKIPVSVKVSPFFAAFGNVARQLDVAGADGVVLFKAFHVTNSCARWNLMAPAGSREL